MRKIDTVVIPVAGLGTRFLPATKAIPKEMFPLVDKPCLEYIVEEAVQSGMKNIIFITNPEKKNLLKKYFLRNQQLEKNLEKKNKNIELKIIKNKFAEINFQFCLQTEAKGDGHAIICARRFLQNKDFAVLFGDDIYDAKTPALKQLLNNYYKTAIPIFAVEKINLEESQKYGIIEPISPQKTAFTPISIKNLIEKPHPQKAPSEYAIAGKYIITEALFKDLQKTQPGKDGEMRIIDGMLKHLKNHAINALEIKGLRFDTGDKKGFLKAQIHFGKKRNLL